MPKHRFITMRHKYASDERVSEMALWPCHSSVEMSRDVIKTVFMPNPHSFAMVLKDTGEPIGSIGLVPEGAEHYPLMESELEAGYWIGRPYWNQGLTTEALDGLIGYCRDAVNLESLLITTDRRNIGSQRVAEVGVMIINNGSDKNSHLLDSKKYKTKSICISVAMHDFYGNIRMRLYINSHSLIFH